jgi:Bacterial SH3 domain
VATRQRALKIEVPESGQDRPRFARVGVIAVIGFAIGIVWPRLAGVRLVPNPPADDGNTPAAAFSSAAAEEKPAPPTAKLATQEARAEDRALFVEVKQPQVIGCRDAQDNRHSSCDAVDFDRVARARLQALATCPATVNAHGTLSVGFTLDFDKQKITDFEAGKSTTLPASEAQSLIDCAKKQFDGTTLAGIDHKFSRYTVFYLVDFLAPEKKQATDAGAATPSGVEQASGQATVSWPVALIREAPRDGKVVARLMRGTRVVVAGKKDDWYQVKYGANNDEGWVYKSAIGL